MGNYINEELEEALRSITSTLSKSEKVQMKLKEGTYQHATIVREINAYKIAIELIKIELGKKTNECKYTNEELEEAVKSISSTNSKVGKIIPKFKPGTSQHTLAIRRIKAFDIALLLFQKTRKKLVDIAE